MLHISLYLLKFVCDFFWIHITSCNVENYITALYQEPKHMHLNKAKINDLGAFRLVAFNLGCLPGGDKNIITKSEITLLARKLQRESYTRRTYQLGGFCGVSWWLVIRLLLLILMVINLSLLIMLVSYE